ncbi:condensin complex subunit [Plasmopara halstedii]|uniref:Condensin complex subunit n=1 Tax=Plasmopara halstedii TaxID=4781 RepID=A0A0P1B3Z3_PLAHL|nr:condensin complex subunit [Plasmopara halstedii]CEG48988.1 condensin complex subunit [Plasmopara halstedii]|eukprot:XP_024585357.1 condensin complex subunit [Plasmopara halstedii]
MDAEWTLTLRQVFQDVQLQAVETSSYLRNRNNVAHQRTLIPAVRRLNTLFNDEVKDSKCGVVEETFVMFLDELWLTIARVLVTTKVSDVVLLAVASLVGEFFRQKKSKSKEIHGKTELRLELLKRLMNATEAEDRVVRFRACHMLQIIVNSLDVIEKDLKKQLKETMFKRLKDKLTSVRIQSIYGLKYLQESDSEDTITRELRILMVSDPAKDVRKAAFTTLIYSSELYDELLVRIRDTSEDVRIAAFRIIGTTVAFQDIPVNDRTFVLDQGLQDRSVRVRRACEQMVLKKWFPACESSPMLLLKALDIEQFPALGSKVSHLLLHDFSERSQGILTNTVEFNALDIMSKTKDAITFESLFFWREQCHYYQKINKDLEKAAALVPNVSEFSKMLVATCNSENDVLVIAKQLLEFGHLLDFQDEVGRRNLLDALQNLLRNLDTDSQLIQGIMELMAFIYSTSSEQEFIQVVAEIVSDMYDSVENDGAASHQEESETTASQQEGITNESLTINFGPRLHKLSEVDREAAEAKVEELEKELETLEYNSEEYTKVQTEMTALEVLLQDPRVLSWLRCLEIVAQLLKLTSHNLSDPIVDGMGRYILPAIDNDVPALREAGLENLGLYCLLDKRLAERYLIVFWRALNNPEEEKEVKHTCVQAILDMAFSFSKLEPHIFGTKQVKDEVRDEVIDVDCSEENEAPNQGDQQSQDKNSEVDQDENMEKIDEFKTTVSSEKLDLDTIFIGLGQLMTVDDVNLQSTLVEGFCRLFMMNRIDSITVLAILLETYFSPELQKMQQQREHGFQSRSLQLLSIFFPAFVLATPANCMLLEEAATHLIQKSMEKWEIENELMLDLSACAKYVMHLLSHDAQEEHKGHEVMKRECAHHNRIGITICLEILALENVVIQTSIRQDIVTIREKALLKILAYIDVSMAERRSAALFLYLLHEITSKSFDSQKGLLRSAEATLKRVSANLTNETEDENNVQAQDQAWAHTLVKEREEILSKSLIKASQEYEKWLKKQEREKKRRNLRFLSSESESESDEMEEITTRRELSSRRSKTVAVSRMQAKEGEFEAKIQRALDQDKRTSESEEMSESSEEEMSESSDEEMSESE